MRVFLTGFMGCGKTTTGRLLAERLQRPFVDLDQWIEESMGRDIRTLFEDEGEAAFRQLEKGALLRATEVADAIVATGGGTVTVTSNRELIRQQGISVWLNPPFATIAERIGSLGKWNRPLFRSETEALALYRKRLTSYRQADVTVDVAPDEEPSEVAARIALLLGGRRACSS